MACGATLKRSLDFDPLHSPGQTTPKRRRCAPMNLSPSTPPRQTQPSPFGEVNPKMTSEQIAANLTMEIRRLQKRKQLQFPGGSASPPHPSQCSSATDNCPSPPALDSPCVPTHPAHCSSNSHFNALSPNKRDIPLFTFKQVSMICERMIKDRESQIREQYNTVLTCKMAEQYEAFLKFNHDQIQRRFSGESVASYVS